MFNSCCPLGRAQDKEPPKDRAWQTLRRSWVWGRGDLAHQRLHVIHGAQMVPDDLGWDLPTNVLAEFVPDTDHVEVSVHTCGRKVSAGEEAQAASKRGGERWEAGVRRVVVGDTNGGYRTRKGWNTMGRDGVNDGGGRGGHRRGQRKDIGGWRYAGGDRERV